MLVAALVVPWFIDWDAYRSTFEREAEKILGQPVHVLGSADASLIPMPSLTFTDVRVGGTPDAPMMQVERFAVRIELIPLITGTFKVVDMAIQSPHLRVTVDGDGTPDWLKRSEASKALDPDAVTLDRVDISSGTIDYLDTRSGRTLSLSNINASVDARSLLGPWKVEGGLEVGGTPATFRIATGRRGDDGLLRVKLDLNPAMPAVAMSLEGPLGIDKDGPTWSGAFSLTHVPADADEGDKPSRDTAWRAEGAFDLRPEQLQLPNFTVTQGPEDRPFTLTGAGHVDLGAAMRFDASIKSRQIDVDRSSGQGPAAPVNVGGAVGALANTLSGLPPPPIPGQIAFDIPGVIVGGSVVQNLHFSAKTAADGWKIEEFAADLPGRSRVTADGMVRTSPVTSFSGGVRLASKQPSIFASWWRGSNGGGGTLLQPFDMSGQVDLASGSLRIGGIAARLLNSNIRGSIDWQSAADSRRVLAIDLKADALDYDQITSLTELFAGRKLTERGGIADSFSVKLATGKLLVGDDTLQDVIADGSYTNGVLVAKRFSIGNLAGAAINASGQLADLSGVPNGQISATVEAPEPDDLVPILSRVLPDARLSGWLGTAAPQLGPAKLSMVLNARAIDATTNANLTLNGTAGGTAIDLALGFAGSVADWRNGSLKLSGAVENADAGQVLRQFGFDALPLDKPGRFRMTAEGAGALGTGVTTSIKGDFAGIAYVLDGAVGVDASGLPTFHGTADLTSVDADPAFSLLLANLPNIADARPLEAVTALDIEGSSIKATFRDAKIGAVHAAGSVGLAKKTGGWSLDGDVALDEVDLDFALGLALGLPPDGLQADEGPWSRTTFGRPAIDGFDASFRLNADQLRIADGLSVSNAALTADFRDQRAELALTTGDFAGGKATGLLSVRNPEGDASLSGQFSVKKAALGDIVWQREGRSVADGTFDLSGQFDGTGRSLSGVVSSLTGGGSLTIGQGTARFVNPEAFTSVIRASNAGKEMSENDLRKLFAGYLDAGTLDFDRIEGAFSIAAGTIRAPNISIVSSKAETAGGATVDLNQGTLDSQWTLTVDPGEDRVSGAIPQVGLAFSGPIDAPARKIDVAPLAGFLSVRAFEREVERIEKLQADILEKEKLGRLVRSYREEQQRQADATRKAEEARQAAEEARRLAEEAAKAKAAEEAKQKAAADAAAAKAAAEAAKKAADEKRAADAKAADDARKAAAAKAAATAKAAADKAAADRAAAAARAQEAPLAPFSMPSDALTPPAIIPNP